MSNMENVELEQVKHIVLYKSDGTRYEMTEVIGLPIEVKISYPDTEGPDGKVRKWVNMKRTIGFNKDFDREVKYLKAVGYQTIQEAMASRDYTK